MKNKKLFAILTLVCFMFTLMPVAAMAEGEEECSSNVVATVTIGEETTTYSSLQYALNAAVAGTGNVTVEILTNVDLNGSDWNPVTVSAPGYPCVTVNGNDKIITGLDNMLFAGTWAGKSGLIINDLTIKNSNIVNDKDDAKGTVGVGAFIGYPQASATITLDNCHLVNSKVEGGHWTGGLIGMAGGYNGNDGPVFMNLTIKDCSVTDSTITGKGSAGAIIGHGSCAAWTNVVIENTVITGNIITSTGSSTNKAGTVMGTIGAAGQAATAAGVTKTGGAEINVIENGNTATSGGTEITTVYGRQGSSTGALVITGGTYENYPIENDVAYAKIQENYCVGETEDGFVVAEHEVEAVEAKVPTCTEDGVKAHYACENCGTLYSDVAGEKVITEPEVDSKKGHAPADTWNKNETYHWKFCTNGCGIELDKAEHVYTNGKCECGAVQQFTVTFSGATVESQTVKYGDKVEKPADPSKSGYTFAGWYSDAEFKTEYKFDAAVTGDITLYAKWTYNAPSYSGGGSYTPSTSDKTESTTTTTPSGDTVKVETETKADGTTVETTTTTTATGETTKVEVTTETNDEGTTVETTVTTDAQGETSTTVTATLDNGSAVTNNDAAVEVEVTKVEEKVVTQVEEAVKADENVEVVGTADNAVSVSATNASTGAAQTSFVQPMAVSVPVDTTVLNNVTDTSKLTMAKVVTNEDGTTELVYMGGSYDKETGKFNAKVNADGDYILVEKADLVKIELNIGETDIKHNDKATQMEVAPRINEDNRTMLQLSYIADALGCQTFWDGATRTVTVVKGDITLTMVIDEVIPGFDTKAVVENGRTLVPAGYISGMLGANVIWDPVDQQVIIVK